MSCISASECNDKLVVSGDKDGKLVVTTIGASTASLKPSSGQIVSLALHPTLVELAAVGYNNGTVLILNIRSGKILFRASGCSDEVQSLAFSPPLPHDGSCFLAYASKDKILGLLSIDGSGSSIQQCGTHKSGKSSGHDSNRSWTTVCWLDHSKFLSSTPSGDIFVWTAPKLTSSKWVHAHSRTIFQLVPCRAFNMIVSISMDRNIITWDCDTKCKLWEMATLGGYVYQLSESPVDPSLIALACGDNSIRIWLADECLSNLESIARNGSNVPPSGSLFPVQLLWKGITSKVTCIQWHPTSTDELIYGLEDGRVFYQTLEKPVSKPTKFSHKQPVYGVSFLSDYVVPEGGTLITAASVAGDGEILLHSHDSSSFDLSGWILERNSNVLHDLSEVSGKQLSSFPRRVCYDFDLDMKWLLIGNADGSIELYSWPLLELIDCSRIHGKLINRIKWKKTASGLLRKLVVTASEDGSICISQYEHTAPSSRLQLLYKIQAHHKSINDVCWSDQEDRPVFVTASSDGTLLYWDALSGRCIGEEAYCKPSKRLAVSWNQQWTDFVLNAGEDQSLCVNLFSRRSPNSQQTSSNSEPDSSKETKESPTHTSISSSSSLASASQTPSYSSFPSIVSKHSQKNSKETSSSKVKGPSGSSRTSHHASSSYSTVHFPGIVWKDSKDPLQDISNWMSNPSVPSRAGTTLDPNLQPSMPSAESFQNVEVAIAQQFISGDIADAILMAMQQGKLNDAWVAMSASGGALLWRKACVAYAELLVSKSDYHKAVLYYLAIRDLDKAIGVYENASMFSDALRIAREKLGEGHPRLNALWISFANYLVHRSQPEMAAKCYLAIGDLENASKLLSGVDTEIAAFIAFNLLLKEYNKQAEEKEEESIQPKGHRVRSGETIVKADAIHLKLEHAYWNWVAKVILSHTRKKMQQETGTVNGNESESLDDDPLPSDRFDDLRNAAILVGSEVESLLLLQRAIWLSNKADKTSSRDLEATTVGTFTASMDIDTANSDPNPSVSSIAKHGDDHLQQNGQGDETSIRALCSSFASHQLQLAHSIISNSSPKDGYSRLEKCNERAMEATTSCPRLLSLQLMASAVLSSCLRRESDCARSLCKLYLHSRGEDALSGDVCSHFVHSFIANYCFGSSTHPLPAYLRYALDIITGIYQHRPYADIASMLLQQSIPASVIHLEEEAASIRSRLSSIDRGSKKRKFEAMEINTEDEGATEAKPSLSKKQSLFTSDHDSGSPNLALSPLAQEGLEERLKQIGVSMREAHEVRSHSDSLDLALLFQTIQHFGKTMLIDLEKAQFISSQDMLALLKRSSTSLEDFLFWKNL